MLGDEEQSFTSHSEAGVQRHPSDKGLSRYSHQGVSWWCLQRILTSGICQNWNEVILGMMPLPCNFKEGRKKKLWVWDQSRLPREILTWIHQQKWGENEITFIDPKVTRAEIVWRGSSYVYLLNVFFSSWFLFILLETFASNTGIFHLNMKV